MFRTYGVRAVTMDMLANRIRPSKYTFEVISVRYTKFRFWGRRSESLLAG